MTTLNTPSAIHTALQATATHTAPLRSLPAPQQKPLPPLPPPLGPTPSPRPPPPTPPPHSPPRRLLQPLPRPPSPLRPLLPSPHLPLRPNQPLPPPRPQSRPCRLPKPTRSRSRQRSTSPHSFCRRILARGHSVERIADVCPTRQAPATIVGSLPSLQIFLAVGNASRILTKGCAIGGGGAKIL